MIWTCVYLYNLQKIVWEKIKKILVYPWKVIHILYIHLLKSNNTVTFFLFTAEQPPTVCLGSISKVGAICTRFLNVTSKVSVDEDHKLHVVGCLEFSLTLFNKTVSAFPVDCFQLPSHEHKIKEVKAIHNFGNWMPWCYHGDILFNYLNKLWQFLCFYLQLLYLFKFHFRSQIILVYI